MSTRNGDSPASGAALAGLAREVESLNRKLTKVAAEAASAEESAHAANRALVDVVDRIQALALVRPAAAPAGRPSVLSWLVIEDEGDARRELAALVQWLGSVFVQYPDGAKALGECWLWHPAAVEELFWLRGAWLDAYVGEGA